MENQSEIKQLESFYKGRKLPDTIQLSPWEKIIDPYKFVSTNLEIIKTAKADRLRNPAYDRLTRLKAIL